MPGRGASGGRGELRALHPTCYEKLKNMTEMHAKFSEMSGVAYPVVSDNSQLQWKSGNVDFE